MMQAAAPPGADRRSTDGDALRPGHCPMICTTTLKQQATAERRSISQEAVRLIRLGLLAAPAGPDARLAAWLKSVRRQRSRWTRAGRRFPDSAASHLEKIASGDAARDRHGGGRQGRPARGGLGRSRRPPGCRRAWRAPTHRSRPDGPRVRQCHVEACPAVPDDCGRSASQRRALSLRQDLVVARARLVARCDGACVAVQHHRVRRNIPRRRRVARRPRSSRPIRPFTERCPSICRGSRY